MTLQVIGAGLGRTGTTSLKMALEKLLGGHCYHMQNVIRDQKQIKLWSDACVQSPSDWGTIFSGYVAAVDTPTSTFWRELIHVYPDALIILSVRDSESWWKSASETVLKRRNDAYISAEWKAMRDALPVSFPEGLSREETIRIYEKHNADVIATVPPERLLVWRAEDGWEPICKALKMPVPNEPFPVTNLRGSWRLRRLFGAKVADMLARILN